MGAKPVSYTKWDSDVTGREVSPPSLEGYTIVGEVGRGSMGQVYEATCKERGAVAIKVMNLFAEGTEMAVERFRREVTVGGRIGHPGIPRVYDSGRLPDGRFFLVMELLRGADLEDWWEEPGHTRAEALDLICEALKPLAAAHRHGVVHRDLKPENIFVEESGSVRLLDFGVARDPDASQNLRTATGISVGTPVYMSPEQATKPTEVDSPADVWSVGVMLYEALCGELPFDGGSPHAVILHACTQEAKPLLERVPEVHEDVRALVDQCLRKDPLDRPADAGALHTSLAAILKRDEVRASLIGPAAAPSFRLSHSTAPTQLKQELASALPAPASTAVSGGELESLEPAPSSRRLVALTLGGLVAAALIGVFMARMGNAETVAAAPETAAESSTETAAESSTETAAESSTETAAESSTETLSTETPSTETAANFATPPQLEVEVELEVQVEEAPIGLAERSGRHTRREPRDVVAPLAEIEAEEPDEAEESPELELVLQEELDVAASESDVVATEPPAQTMRAEPEVMPTTRAQVVTMRPRMRPTMRTRPSEMRPERPDFVTF